MYTAFKKISFVFSFSALLLACGHRKEALNNAGVHLEWAGVSSTQTASDELSPLLTSVSFKLLPVLENRSNPSEIGRYEEEKVSVTTTEPVAEYLTHKLSDEFSRAGMKLSENADALELKPELLVYEVKEGNIYQGNVRIRFTLQKGEKLLWTELIEGKSKRWGSTHSHDMINETLSNATDEVIRKLLNSKPFAEALAKTKEPETPVASKAVEEPKKASSQAVKKKK